LNKNSDSYGGSEGFEGMGGLRENAVCLTRTFLYARSLGIGMGIGGEMGLLGDFERIMDGGLRENTLYLVRGLPGSGKTAFCMTLMREMLEGGKDCVYLTTELSPKSFTDHARHGFGWDFEPFEREGRLQFLDACSWKSGGGGAGALDASDLMTMSHELGRLLSDVNERKRGKFFLFFDSVTSLLLYNPVEVVVKFLQVLATRMRETGNPDLPGIFTLEEGVHDEKVMNALSFFMDGIFETRLVPVDADFRREFRVTALKTATHRMKWLPVKIDRSGFGFPDEAFKEAVEWYPRKTL